MKDYVKIGKIVNTHGVKGYVTCISLSDNIERFDELEYVYTEKDDRKRKIKEVFYKKGTVCMSLEGIDDMTSAEIFKNTYISILEGQLKELPEDTYYLFDLEGMKVFSTEGAYLGEISEIYQPGANDVYEIKNGDKTFLIPAVKEVVKDVNMKERKIIINIIEGLLEWNLI